MHQPMENHGADHRTQKKEENPNPGPDYGVLATFTQVCEQTVHRDWVKEVDNCLEKGYQAD